MIKVAHLGRRALGDATPRETWEVIDARAQRLGEPDEEAIAAFVENTKKYPRLARALRESDRPDLEIAGAIWMASGESPYGYPLSLGEIEWRIERDPPSTFDRRRGNSAIVKDARAQVRAAERRAFEGQLRPEEHKEAMRALLAAEERLEDALKYASEGRLEDTLKHAGEEGEELRLIVVLPEGERYRGVWLSPGAGGGMLPTPEWEERLLDRLFLAHYADAQNPAGLSPSELEVFQLARGLEHWEISEKIGRTVNQVRQFKHHAVRKVREHGGIQAGV